MSVPENEPKNLGRLHRFGHLMTSEEELRRMLRKDLWSAVTEITERIAK